MIRIISSNTRVHDTEITDLTAVIKTPCAPLTGTRAPPVTRKYRAHVSGAHRSGGKESKGRGADGGVRVGGGVAVIPHATARTNPSNNDTTHSAAHAPTQANPTRRREKKQKPQCWPVPTLRPSPRTARRTDLEARHLASSASFWRLLARTVAAARRALVVAAAGQVVAVGAAVVRCWYVRCPPRRRRLPIAVAD
ncbi:hypothetical protein GUJ93_ZPchr0006g46368 [Zizania palustris]|uniref:Uncharacterized protein n=1 Tax=Zizania palustris TaxID=103762 RepID=A0A8J5W2T0_ZIZPA|nr:hypothetical protein GUJ93_ZPchr0006g46368 [Zizania palustris]